MTHSIPRGRDAKRVEKAIYRLEARIEELESQLAVSNQLLAVSAGGPDVYDIFSRQMDTVGDGTGTVNANGNYSVTAEEFKIVPSAGFDYYVHRMLVAVEDGATMAAAEYGNLGSALSNGIRVVKRTENEVLEDYTDSNPVTTNAEWSKWCYDADIKAWGPGDEFLAVRWTFANAGYPVHLSNGNGEYLAVILNDDMTGLTTHSFVAQGYRVPV